METRFREFIGKSIEGYTIETVIDFIKNVEKHIGSVLETKEDKKVLSKVKKTLAKAEQISDEKTYSKVLKKIETEIEYYILEVYFTNTTISNYMGSFDIKDEATWREALGETPEEVAINPLLLLLQVKFLADKFNIQLYKDTVEWAISMNCRLL